ncbi:MAG TPA: aldo/keto reductase [Marinilabiliales bacterium]|nr:aldo/keto reductase [Marinilabiliales bacterium]
MPYGIGVSSEKDMLSESKAIELLHTAFDSGINFFDTARMYGESEKIMGKAFKARRDKVVLATKCRHLLNSDGNLPNDSMLKTIVKDSLYESLKTLQTDYVDIFMLHQANQRILENEAIVCVLSELKERGLFRAMGVSTYTTDETKMVLDSGHWNMIQLPFNLMDQRQGDLFEDAHHKGVGLVVRSVLLKGLLSDRGKNLHPALKDVENHIAKYQSLLEETNLKLPALATKFALSFSEVSSVLVGIDKRKYLDEALKTVDGIYLDKEKLEKANQLAYPEPEFINLPYWDRMNWLK